MKLTNMQMDAIKEIGNIGSGNAATSLSKMLGSRIDMEMPDFKIQTIEKVTNSYTDLNKKIVGICVGLSQDIEGAILLMFDTESAKYLSNLLLKEEKEGMEFDDMQISALKEIGNIISGAFASSISTFTNMNITLTIPDIAIDMVGAVVTFPLIEYAFDGEEVIYIETNLCDGNRKINSDILLIPDSDSYIKMLKALGV